VARGQAEGAKPVRLISTNRQARFRYELLDSFEAGLVLMGSEVKALRANLVSLADAYVRFRGDEAWLANCHVGPYTHATVAAHEPLRERKLLLRGAELEKLQRAVSTKGLTIVPTKIYFKGDLVKIEIALARGKKTIDKRETIKQRDVERRARRGDHD
jgi:SsrA-binding protein